ncbi:MAG: cytochrome c biogenesis protein CcdA [Gemmatimonadetes bacterium]|nr:cytochrome c biogenesis protein CcdA [Gemmatimonadota bacterium]
MDSISFAVAFLAGFLSFLSPCVLPLVPAYLGFVTGMSLDDLRDTPSRRAIMVPASFFVLGFSLVFLLLGAGATLAGQLFNQYQQWIARIGGVIVILFGLHLLGVFRLTPLLRDRRMHLASTPKGYFGATITGVAFGAGWTPCIGPVLGTLLTWAAIRDTMWSAMGLLVGYSLGLAVPFLLAAVATGSFLRASRRMRGAIPVLEKASGALLLVLGLLLVTGTFTALSAFFVRFTPDFLLDRL